MTVRVFFIALLATKERMFCTALELLHEKRTDVPQHQVYERGLKKKAFRDAALLKGVILTKKHRRSILQR